MHNKTVMFLATMPESVFFTYIVIKKAFGFFDIINKKFTVFCQFAFENLLRDVMIIYGKFTLARRMKNWYN